jgi:hypothetical protein
VLRIFPIYYLVLTLSVVIGHFWVIVASMLPPWTSWKVSYFFCLQNWPVFWHGDKMMGGLWGAYWSLAVEEQFYFLWPLAIFSFREGDYKALLYRASVRAPIAHFSPFFLLRQSVRIVADHSKQGGWIVYGSDLLDLHVLAQEAGPYGNVRKALNHVKAIAEQLPSADRWKTLLAYIIARIIPKRTPRLPIPGAFLPA